MNKKIKFLFFLSFSLISLFLISGITNADCYYTCRQNADCDCGETYYAGFSVQCVDSSYCSMPHSNCKIGSTLSCSTPPYNFCVPSCTNSGGTGKCRGDACPDYSGWNGQSCEVVKDCWNGWALSCYRNPCTGKWDASNKQCVTCNASHQKTNNLGDSGGINIACDNCNGISLGNPGPCESACGADPACDEKVTGDGCGYGSWENDLANPCKEKRQIYQCSSTCGCVASGTYEYRNKTDGTSCNGECGICSSGSCSLSNNKCPAIDTDSGKDYFTKGTCTMRYCNSDFMCIVSGSLTDSCSGNILFEYYSGSGSGPNYCSWEEKNCTDFGSNYICSDGKCLPTYTLTVSKSGTGTGTVTSSPSGINCGSDCSETYNSNTSVTLTASPNSGSGFAGWSGDCSGTGTCTINMNSNKSATATFNALLICGNSIVESGEVCDPPDSSNPANDCQKCASDCKSWVNKTNGTACAGTSYCSGTNRCGSSSGDTRYYNFTCQGGSCIAQSSNNCACDASDSDGGSNYTTQGTCYDYNGCSGGSCQTSAYTDSCNTSTELKEYYVSGSGDSATCAYSTYNCTGLGSDYTCSGGKCVSSSSSCPSTPSSYPTDYWDRVWCAKSFSGNKLSDTPEQSNVQFDDNWGAGSVGGIRADDIGFRSGRTINLEAGTYTFYLGSDDGSRLWIDGTLCIDRWVDQGYPSPVPSCTKTFTSTADHQFRIDYYENTGDARVRFYYTFTPITYALNVTKSGTGTGTVTSSPSGINCGSDCSETYNSNTSVTLTASPSPDSNFTSWVGCDSVDGNICNVTMNSIKNITVNFSIKVSADFCCSLDESNWLPCKNSQFQDLEEGTEIFFKDDPSCGNSSDYCVGYNDSDEACYSYPPVTLSRNWEQRNGESIPLGTGISASTTLPAGEVEIWLCVINGAENCKSYSFKSQPPLPEWREISPF